jgi:FtsZ-binding cell division protein ZapB
MLAGDRAQRAPSPLSRHRNQDAVDQSKTRVSSELANGLEHLLEAAVDGPLQRIIGDFEERFAALAESNNDLQHRVEQLERDNSRLQAELDGVPLAEELSKLQEENDQLRADMEREVRQRHRETEEINTVLRDVSAYVESMDSYNAAVRRHHMESSMRATVWRLRNKGLSACWNMWKTAVQEKIRQQRLANKAVAKFRHRSMGAAFFTWVSWTRVQVTSGLKGNQGVGQAFSKLKQQMETEVAQRHYEVEQINIVLKQLAFVVDASDSTRSRERAHHIQSTMTKTLHRMANRRLATAWSAWHSVWFRMRRRRNMLAKATSTWTRGALVRCFEALATQVKRARAQKHMSALEILETQIAEVREMAHRTTDGIEDLIRDSVVHMYYETSEAKRQADIQRALQRTIVRLTLGLLARAFSAWKQRYLRFKRLKHLQYRALQRFLNVLLAKTFQPWAAMARQTAKNRHEATVISNFEQVDLCRKRIDDIHQSLARIFTTDPTSGVYAP